jgi:hypothetical protein
MTARISKITLSFILVRENKIYKLFNLKLVLGFEL